MQQRLEQSKQLSPISLQPLISYPKEAQAGKTYLMTIDVQLENADTVWPYPEEEYEISFILDLHPYFSYQALSKNEPTIILHRFGGTYGPAEFLLTANTIEIPKGEISITFLNASGLPMADFELPCEIKQVIQANTEQSHITIPSSSNEELSTSPTSSILSSMPAHIEKIEQQLQQVGWTIVEYENYQARSWGPIEKDNPMLITCVAIKSLPSYPNDYILTIMEEIVGFVRTLHPDEPLTDSTKTVFSSLLARSMHLSCKYDMIPFVYESTGTKTQITNKLEINARCREVYTFHLPATLQSWIDSVPDIFATTNNLFRSQLQGMPPPKRGRLQLNQFQGLQALEQSLTHQYPRVLIQMTTRRGKTNVLIHSIYHLLKYAHAKRILYIVNSPKAKDFAIDIFKQNTVEQNDSNASFELKSTLTELYNVQNSNENILDQKNNICIAILEDVYSLLTENQSLHISAYDSKPVPIKYNKNLPIEYFDAIVLKQSELIDYGHWKPLLEYFDAPIIGFADDVTVKDRDFFHQNLVYPSPKSQEEIDKQLLDTIKSVRSLLHKDAGMQGEIDRLTQLTWLLFLKILDDFEMTQEEMYGDDYLPIIQKPYRWRDWVEGESPIQRRTGNELLDFVNNNLTNYLKTLSGDNSRDIRSIISTIFKDTYNRLRSGYILRDTVNELNTINFNVSDSIQTTISPFYETMLKEMSNIAGDAGEFYTPQPIVRFVIDRLNPQLSESVMDPACGTAGFLVKAYTRMARQVHTTEQQKLLFDSLIGIEKKSVPYLLAITNMLLHGVEVPNIYLDNALAVNINQISNDEQVNIIATNPPFGGQEEDGIVNNFSAGMRTYETNLLFFQLIMASLKRPGGRAGVVIPNGFLFRKGIGNLIKENLVKRFNLHTIIRLCNGVFSPYTSIPTNILFFEAEDDIYPSNNLYPSSTLYPKTPTATQEIWYYEIPLPEGRQSYTKTKPLQNEDFQACIDWWDNRVENAHAWKVSIEEIIENDYNLDFKNPHTL